MERLVWRIQLTSRKKRTHFTAIDLFSGCGGTTVGLKQAGYRVLCAVELASAPMRAYAANHPEVLLKKEDIRNINCAQMLRDLKLEKGELDLLAGCPPCQGFSTMRTKNGKILVHDDRNNPVQQFYRFTRSFLPKAVMLENVPGLKDSEEFSDFVRKMRKLGYLGEWKILNAKDFGVPQRRRRLIYVAGYKKHLSADAEVLPEISVRSAISELPEPGNSGDKLHDLPERRSEHIQRMISLVPKDGGSRTDLPDEFVLPCHKKRTDGFKDVYGRMAWEKPSPTITGGCASPSKGRFLHPEKDRCITLREAAVLQGFPVDYKFPEPLNKADLALMIGNALPAPFIHAHASKIADVLS